MAQFRIALIEFQGSHDECLMTQILALKDADCDLYWVTTAEMAERNINLHQYFCEIEIVELKLGGWRDFQTMRSVSKFIHRRNISRVVYNTAQGANVRNLAWMLPRRVRQIGLIHTIRKFEGSFTQKLIHNRIKKYMVLSDFLLEKVTPPKGIDVVSFYPVDYKTYTEKLEKPKDEIWLCSPGGLELRRKDIAGLKVILEQTKDINLKFIFLGKSDFEKPEITELKDWLKNLGFEQKVIFFDSFISAELFDAYIQSSDALIPLIHPDTLSAEQYITNQISGAFNLAYGYKIPLLIHENYSYIKDFQMSALFYSLENFREVFNDFKSKIRETTTKIEATSHFSSSFQKEKFANFVLG